MSDFPMTWTCNGQCESRCGGQCEAFKLGYAMSASGGDCADDEERDFVRWFEAIDDQPFRATAGGTSIK